GYAILYRPFLKLVASRGRMARPIFLLVLALFLTSCSIALTSTPIPPTQPPTSLPPPTEEPTPLPPTATPTVVASSPTLWVEPNLDRALRTAIEGTAQSQNLELVPDPANASLVVTLVESPDPLLLTETVYAVADRFSSL